MNEKDPNQWISKIHFTTSILTALTAYAEVHHVNVISYRGVVAKDLVNFHFLKSGLIGKFRFLYVNRYVKTLRPDVVIVHGLLFPLEVFHLRTTLGNSTPIFIQHHAEKPLRFYKRMFQRMADRKVNGYFFSARQLAEPWIRAEMISSQRKIYEVMEVSTEFSSTQQYSHQHRKPKYLWVGRCDRNKDPFTLLSAFVEFLKVNPLVQLTVVFKTERVQVEVEELINTFSETGRIHFLQNLPKGEMMSLYNEAGFIISTSYYEGSGTAVCEAMACGCIPILTDIPSFRMITNNGSIGLLFAPGKKDLLFQALVATLAIDTVNERKEVLRYFSENLSPQAIAKKLFEIASNPELY